MNTAKIAELIAEGREHEFYISTEWKRLADAVRKLDHYECQHCKRRGRYRRGVIVHHVKHLKNRPDLAMNIVDPETGERQLITVCKQCHELEHPEALRETKCRKNRFETEERWD